jgi:hypothetical protein
MALSRTLCSVVLLLLAGLGVSSCLTPPDYPETPEIGFKSISKQRLDNRFGVYDTVIVTVSFKDGDGDLGLNNDDTAPPFNELDANQQPNKYYNNYFFQPQLQTAPGQFEDTNIGFGYNSRYPRLSPSDQGGREEPLKGDLSFGLNFFQGTFAPGSVVRFKVKILDRKLHESNEVTTDPITFN